MASQTITNSSPLTAAGETKRLDEWAAGLGVPVQTVISRLKRGWPVARAVTEPATAAASNRGATVAPEILVGDEITRLLEAGRKGATHTRDTAMIVVAYRAGLRCCEVLALRLKDVDVAAQTITILHGKGDKRRVVGIDSKAWSIVQQWIDERADFTTAPDSPLFCTRAGTAIDSRQVRRMMKARGVAAGLEKHVHLHGLRHTMASEMAAEGVPLLDIAGALGHSKVSTTSHYLSQLSPTSVLNAMRGRTWGQSTPLGQSHASRLPPPDWLTRLRSDIGERLTLFHDARQDESNFRAILVLT